MKSLIALIIGLFIAPNNAFLNPSVKTASGKKLNIIGQGPPTLFSPGLFGTMPRFFYNNYIDALKKNLTIVTLDGFNPVNENTIDEVCDALNVDKINYLSHSSFFPEVLDNKRIQSAVLLDPINLPWISFDGFSNSIINLKYPTLIIKAGKLYEGSKTLPEWQNPEFKGEFNEEIYNNVGHPDILDNVWANIAKQIGIWEMTEGPKMSINEWKFNSNNNFIVKMRKEYRKYVAGRTLCFIHKNLNIDE